LLCRAGPEATIAIDCHPIAIDQRLALLLLALHSQEHLREYNTNGACRLAFKPHLLSPAPEGVKHKLCVRIGI
jgi:hypothetical protein